MKIDKYFVKMKLVIFCIVRFKMNALIALITNNEIVNVCLNHKLKRFSLFTK